MAEKEDNNQPQNEDRFIASIKEVFSNLKSMASISADTDYEATVTRIENGIEFKGTNVWILFFAFIIASVGLNVNSTAVIIGAMLISPLMGPILGMGLAIGINDNGMLHRSLVNLVVMMLISLLASSLYFFISPLNEAQSELLARTNPTIYDVFIAFFGGLAGITAQSRKDTPMAVISGVAIATALMPPLCTAGYGLATSQPSFFFGALYLFFINTVFIALATFVMVRMLHFPHRKYLDEKKARKVRITITLFSVLVIIPSFFLTYNVVKKTSFDVNVSKYISYIQDNLTLKNSFMVKSSVEYGHDSSVVSVSIIGDSLTHLQMNLLEAKMADFDLKNTQLIVSYLNSDNENMSSFQRVIENNELRINTTEQELAKSKALIKSYQKQQYPVEQLMKECKLQFTGIKTFSIANIAYPSVKEGTLDTIPTLLLYWKKNADPKESAKIQTWIKTRLNINDLKVFEGIE